MPRFRKKPVIVEAHRFMPDQLPWPRGVVENYVTGSMYGRDDGMPAGWKIATPEGEMRVSPGDWIITGVKGERYPCKPDIFDATYEEVES